MHLSSADMKASREGFKFLVLSPTGTRKCYCTTAKEAKAEAGKGGKIVVLARGRYAALNPTAEQVGLRNPKAKYVLDVLRRNKKSALKQKLEFGSLAEARKQIKRLPIFYDYVATVHKGDTLVETYYCGIMGWTLASNIHAEKLNPRKRRNPTAHMIGFQRNPAKHALPAILANAHAGNGWEKFGRVTAKHPYPSYQNISEDGSVKLVLTTEDGKKWSVTAMSRGWDDDVLKTGKFEAVVKHANKYISEFDTPMFSWDDE